MTVNIPEYYQVPFKSSKIAKSFKNAPKIMSGVDFSNMEQIIINVD